MFIGKGRFYVNMFFFLIYWKHDFSTQVKVQGIKRFNNEDMHACTIRTI